MSASTDGVGAAIVVSCVYTLVGFRGLVMRMWVVGCGLWVVGEWLLGGGGVRDGFNSIVSYMYLLCFARVCWLDTHLAFVAFRCFDDGACSCQHW